jgi:peptidoglycan/xylan/chitin deacetylase (PgdA/CDA1 family)
MPAINIERYPDIAMRAKQEGHIIGNHCYGHPHLLALSYDEVVEQLEKAESVFKRILGIKPVFFRPPYGEYNSTIEKIIKRKGYRLILWDDSCYSQDWKQKPAGEIVKISTSKAKNGSIIVLHDGRNIRSDEPRDNTVSALSDIIMGLRKRGFDIVRLDKLFA